MLKRLKKVVSMRAPSLVRNWRRIKFHPVFVGSRDQVFTKIYHSRMWGDPESASGTGSNLAQTEEIRHVLPSLLEELNCQSLLDVPCGDFYWMRLLDLDIDYTGGDIVTELIDHNQQQYGNDNRKFIVVDLVEDQLPQADLFLCRDCLVHLSYQEIFCALDNIKASGAEYLLTTTYTRLKQNYDIPTGSFRPIRLDLPPFSFPEPLRIINEKCPDPGFDDKALALYRIRILP